MGHITVTGDTLGEASTRAAQISAALGIDCTQIKPTHA